jgi:NAD(P)H-hydrate epimerase
VFLDAHNAIVAGPGLGGGVRVPDTTAKWLGRVWKEAHQAVIFDADALVFAVGGAVAPRVVTPHPGEASRMLQSSIPEIQRDRFAAVAALASGGRTALLKGRNTLVAAASSRISINPTGNPVLATAGSGDVLAGVIGALLARGLTARDATRMGAWAHGRAGDLLAANTREGWTASDIADCVPRAIAELLEQG